MMHEFDVVKTLAGGLLEHLERARTRHLEEKDSAGKVLALEIEPSLHKKRIRKIRRHPVGKEVVVGQPDDHSVLHDQALLGAHDSVLAGADREVLEGVDADPGQRLDRLGAAHPEGGRGIEIAMEIAGLFPSQGFISPARVLVGHGVGKPVPVYRPTFSGSYGTNIECGRTFSTSTRGFTREPSADLSSANLRDYSVCLLDHVSHDG